MHPPAQGRVSRGVHSAHTESSIFGQYYRDRELIVAPEGILKLLTAVSCTVLGVLHLSSSCAAARGGWGAAPLASACLCALIYAALALHLPRHAPVTFLYLDLTSSAVMGVTLLITVAFTMWTCGVNTVASYVLGPLGVASAMMVIASAAVTYVSVMRLWDKSHTPWEPPRPPAHELDV